MKKYFSTLNPDPIGVNSQLSILQRGQTLIEVLAAFGIAVSLVTAITVTVIFALSTTRSGKNKNLATQHAQEGVEIVRRMQAEEFDNASDKPCLKIGRTILTSKEGGQNCPADESPFLREVKIENTERTDPCGGVKQIKVTVKWSDNTCGGNIYCNETSITSCLPKANNAVATPGKSDVSPTPTKVPFPVPVLSFSIGTDGHAYLNWNSVFGAISYNIYKCDQDGCKIPNKEIFSDVKSTSKDVGTINTGARCYLYAFNIEAVFPNPNGGVSQRSNTVQVGFGCGGDDPGA